MKCDDCSSEDAEKVFCPYAEDVGNEKVEVVICTDCYNERVMDI